MKKRMVFIGIFISGIVLFAILCGYFHQLNGRNNALTSFINIRSDSDESIERAKIKNQKSDININKTYKILFSDVYCNEYKGERQLRFQVLYKGHLTDSAVMPQDCEYRLKDAKGRLLNLYSTIFSSTFCNKEGVEIVVEIPSDMEENAIPEGKLIVSVSFKNRDKEYAFGEMEIILPEQK